MTTGLRILTALVLLASAAPAADLPAGMVALPGGAFLMGVEDGADNPRHEVTVSPFWIDVREVTNMQYGAFCEATGRTLPVFWGMDEFHCGPDWPDHPVVGVSHGDATAYAAWAGKRLPTEAEWEYAARGGLEGKAFPNGDEGDPAYVNHRGAGHGGTLAVGTLGANEFGLHDTAGNVREWVSDRYDPDFYRVGPPVDPRGPDAGRFRVVRGGGWKSGASCCRIGRRNGLASNWGDFNVGFRCAMTPVGADDPEPDYLPSWRDGEVKRAIVAYVAAVADLEHADFVPTAERVAVFDNDGTFWCERPGYPSALFQAHMVGVLAERGEIDGEAMPYRAWIDGDRDALREFGWRDAYAAMTQAFAGIPVQAFRDSARAFVARSEHPRYGVRYDELYYAPMLELKRLLDAHGFQVWVVTGGEQDFVRSYLEEATGVPPERVIGSWTPAVAERDGAAVTTLRTDAQVYNGHEAKPANIDVRIGRRPIFAVGNSDNDQPMCRQALTGARRGFALWIRHDDEEREYVYGRTGTDMEAMTTEFPDAHGVSMANDWTRLFRGMR